MSEIIKRKLQD